MPNWTRAQRAAIETHGTDVLVSAAAGSGKTAALTQRIINHISAGASLDRFLIVTFSRASAADMKSKLSRELRRRAEENPNDKTIARAIAELPSARIGTIHSFCSSLLRRYYGELSLPAKSRIADDAESKLMKSECMDETLDYFFSLPATENHDPESDFVALTDHLLGGQSDEVLAELFISLYDKTSCLPRRYETLTDSALAYRRSADTGDFLLSAAGSSVSRIIRRGLDYYTKIFDTAVCELAALPEFAAKHLPAYEYISRFLRRADELLSLGDYGALSLHLSSFAPPSLRGVRGEKPPRTEYFKEKKGELGKYVKQIHSRYFTVSPSELSRTLRRTASVTLGIVRVLDEFDRRYTAEKRRRGALDYGDLEHYALTLLSDPVTAKRIGEDYDEIYIDEYQDCNAVQDSIFAAVAKRNRFMVGDVKQSIYAFRGADPTLFDSHRKSYEKIDADAESPKYDMSDAESGASVFMSDNFRCDTSVIRFTNAVCGAIMPYGNVSYTAVDELRRGKKEPDSPPIPVKIILASAENSDTADEDAGENEENTALDAESEAIASEVARILREERRRTADENDGSIIKPDDVAILLRSAANGRAQRIEDALRRHGIGVSNDTKPNFFECPEVLLVLCLLHTVNNPLRDVYLAGALRSPVFGFSLDELIKISESGSHRSLYRSLRELAEGGDASPLSEKCRHTYEVILRWREAARYATSDRIIAQIYKETGIEALLWSRANRENGTVPPELRAANLTALYEYARTYEASSYRGLHRFLDYVSSIIERGATTVGESASAPVGNVRIMTVHQSKGLEFPVVILAGCGSPRNEQDTKSSVIYEKTAGLAMLLRADDEGESPVMLETLPHRAVAAAMSESLAAEEMRILYVALTRAKERLVITAKTNDLHKTVDKRRTDAEFFGEHTVYAERSYIGWILSSVFRREAEGMDVSEFVNIITAEPDGSSSVIVGTNADADANADAVANASADAAVNRALIDEYKAKIKEQLAYVYPYTRLGKLPAKLAVSDLYPAVLDEDATPIEEAAAASAPSPEAEAAARAGTATHLFMQFCDFDYAETNGVRAEAERLCRLGFMRNEDAELIRYGEAERFFRSSLYEKMKLATLIRREQRFNIRLPAADFTENEADRELYAGEELLVQGVIDCFFVDEDGELILIDYKTDRLSSYELSHRRAAEEKLISRHARQLSYYAEALFAIFGRYPAHVYIYSLPLGDAIEVDVK